MRDIVVTTPKNKVVVAAEEARQCIQAGGGFYFRTFRNRPKDKLVTTGVSGITPSCRQIPGSG